MKHDADTPPILRLGFRPFFLAAGIWATAAIAVWLPLFHGSITLPTSFDPIAWHVHEMLFGYVAAVVAGFLLTAIPNWTGRLPLQGPPLAALVFLWLAGRVAVLASGHIGGLAVAIVDLSFPAALLAAVVREIVAGRNWRNLPMPLALAVLLTANALTHMEAMGLAPTGAIGQRLGIATIILLISVVGGRIIPSFTRNWLAKRGEARLPVGFNRFDKACVLLVLAALLCWVALPESMASGAMLAAAGLASLARLARWRGHRSLSEPLVWSLHLGFAWLPTGLVLTGLSALSDIVPPAAGLHALTAGAMGSMTLAVMTRASLGHSNRELAADRTTTAIYLLVFAAAALRVAAAFAGDFSPTLLWGSAAAWTIAFGLFVIHYGAVLLARGKG